MNDANEGSAAIALVLNRDLLFGSRIRGALSALGLQARFVPTTEQFVAALNEHAASVAIGIVDMNGAIAWDLLGEAVAARNLPPILAFGPHTDVANRRAAKAAGVSRVVSNGQFHGEMAALINRYRLR